MTGVGDGCGSCPTDDPWSGGHGRSGIDVGGTRAEWVDVGGTRAEWDRPQSKTRRHPLEVGPVTVKRRVAVFASGHLTTKSVLSLVPVNTRHSGRSS